jgi:serine/threonine-protein kinase
MKPGESDTPLCGSRLADRYELVQRIGKGCSGEVYRAVARGDVEVAVKIVPLPSGEATRRELRWLGLVKRLRHAFLVPVHEFWIEGDHLYVVMELADRSLRDWYNQKAWNSSRVPELQKYIGEAAEALDFLHGHGVLHRDVKPDNLLLVGNHAKVGDCGLARLRDNEWLKRATCAGTPGFMSPEAWNGEPGFSSDQYGLAVTYVELRLGRLPFVGSNPVELMKAHLFEEPYLGPLAGEERRILLRALAKKPGGRYVSCADFAQALRDAVPEGGSRDGDEIGGRTQDISTVQW